jgi:hypothetical protein
VPPVEKSKLLFYFSWLVRFTWENGCGLNKNLEKIRNFFSQNFEILGALALYNV